MDLSEEFDRQTRNLVQKQYPEIAGISPRDFIKQLEPLKVKLLQLELPAVDIEEGRLPFVIVTKSDWVPTGQAMSLVNKDGKTGITNLFPHKPDDFHTINGISIPDEPVYGLVDIDRGKTNRNTPPNEALKDILKEGRSPLTIDEGVAVVTQFPEFIIKNNCFSLLASRHQGDQRVPAIWINANKNPNLGWCWDGNPHTWLGSASCKTRLGN